MAPKSFPFPIGVGVDVCKINRIAALTRQDDLRSRWARRVFTRLEWAGLCRRCQRANILEGEPIKQTKREMQKNTDSKKRSGSDIWSLPKLSKYSEILENDDQSAYWSAITDGRSRLGKLARYLAGRWAAKEAIIKAHRHRRLYMQEISIIESPNSDKVIALIDPACNIIQMDERVAALRGLRGFGPQSQGLFKRSLNDEGENESLQVQEKKSRHLNRRGRIKETERQTAEINISHDGEYAVAICMAFDAPGLHPKGRCIVDDGAGAAIHEPQWGDEGWFDTDYTAKDEEWRNKSIDDLLDGGTKASTDTEDYENALKKALKSADDWKIPSLP